MAQTSIFKNTRFLFILITGFLSVLGIGLIIPVIPFIVAQYIPAHKTNEIAFYVGLLTSLYAFCQFFAAPVLGALSDRYGRRPVLLICLVGSAIGYLLFGIGGSLGVLFLGRIIDGLTGGDISTVMAYIADVTEPQERGRYFGVVGATVGLGFILGPTFGGLVSHLGLSAPMYFAAAITLLNAAWGFFVLPESLAKEHRMTDFSLHHLNPFGQIQQVMNNKLLKMLLIIGLFYFFAFAQLQGITSVFFKDTLHWTPGNIGFYFLILGIGDMVTQGYLTGKLLPKFGAVRLVIGGFLITGIAYAINAILPLFPYTVLTYGYILIYALGSGLFEPSMAGLISHAAPPREQGRVQGASQSLQSIARIIGPLFAAFLYQFGHSWPYITCVILSLIGMILMVQYKEEIDKHVHVTSAH